MTDPSSTDARGSAVPAGTVDASAPDTSRVATTRADASAVDGSSADASAVDGSGADAPAVDAAAPGGPDAAAPGGPDAAEPHPSATTPRTPAELARDLEALLFLADEPLDALTLATATEQDPAEVEAALEQLAARSLAEDRGLVVRAVAGGWRMSTAPATHPSVERWALSGRTGRLTQAALETLAVIAYKQPIGRADIGEIRGVNADGAVRSLVARGFVEEVGREPSAGQAVLYGTTRLLLERLGIDTIDELPPLTDFLPEAPAPDEPDLGALKEVRRRLQAGDELPVGGLGGRTASQTNTGGEVEDDEADEDVLPQPVAPAGGGRDDAQMDELTDRLEIAARNAVDRLRAAVAAGTAPDEPPDEPTDGPGDERPDGTDTPRRDQTDAPPRAPDAHDAPSTPDHHDTPHGAQGATHG